MRRGVTHPMLLGVLLAALAPAGAAATSEPDLGAVARAQPAPFTLLDHEPRLRTKLDLARPPENVGQLFLLIARTTGVQIICQGDFLRKTVMVAVKDQEAREIMTQIALVTRGMWIRRKEVYLLVENGIDWTVFTVGGNRLRVNDAAKGLFHSLTPAQRKGLQKQVLPYKRLSFDQRQYVDIALYHAWTLHPEWFNREMIDNAPEAQIRLIPAENGATEIWIESLVLSSDNSKRLIPVVKYTVPAR